MHSTPKPSKFQFFFYFALWQNEHTTLYDIRNAAEIHFFARYDHYADWLHAAASYDVITGAPAHANGKTPACGCCYHLGRSLFNITQPELRTATTSWRTRSGTLTQKKLVIKKIKGNASNWGFWFAAYVVTWWDFTRCLMATVCIRKIMFRAQAPALERDIKQIAGKKVGLDLPGTPNVCVTKKKAPQPSLFVNAKYFKIF